MKNTNTCRNANFTKLIELTKNREHDLHGVPLTMMLGMVLQMIKGNGIAAGSFQLGVVVTKVDMYDHLQEITDYVDQNIDAAIAETLDHTTLAW
ncbi:MAG: hypothetical protein CVV41_18075 [Candidatus Riflebacteria bacterium HGW-Riflebacteria-1]|jgi:hypothetical protein|nr:MAG: hypothetical protein CVV41_18075 [Candidatus Riflebacteria bacterium HGW-Riflebacteria-1]